MIKKSRFVLATALVLALGVAGIAFATGADDNTPFVDGKFSPAKKLGDEKSEAKKGSLFTGLRNVNAVTGQQSNPASEKISFPKTLDLSGLADLPECPAAPANGASPEQARASCPEGAFLGSGEASVQFPGQPLIEDVTVTALHGPTGATPPAARRAQVSEPVILHTSSPTLRTSAPSVQSYIVKSTAGPKYGSMLWVPNTPQTGSGLILKFNATLEKSVGITAYCKPSGNSNKGVFNYLREVAYKDGSAESVKLKQTCKVKKSLLDD